MNLILIRGIGMDWIFSGDAIYSPVDKTFRTEVEEYDYSNKKLRVWVYYSTGTKPEVITGSLPGYEETMKKGLIKELTLEP